MFPALQDYPASSRWVHELTLLVVMHELVQANVTDYSLSPWHVDSPVHGFLNVSIEGRHDLEELRAAGLVDVAIISSDSDYASCTVTASSGTVQLLRLSEKGKQVCAKLLSPVSRKAVNSVLYRSSTEEASGEPLKVIWSQVGKEFLLSGCNACL